MNGEHSTRTFLSPFDVPTPEGAEGWAEMYPYYTLFGTDRRDFDENKFWFYNGMHFPEPLQAFNLVSAEAAYVSLGQFEGRVFSIPTTLGIDHRVLNGYVYISTNLIEDPDVMARRAEDFQRRAGYYYANWEELLAKWQSKVDAEIREIRAVSVPDLPELEPEERVFAGEGLSSGYDLLAAYDRCLRSYYRIWQLHFEMLLLGYSAYLTFFHFCKDVFPDIAEQTVTSMVSGFDVTMFRPDEELKQLARMAVDTGVAHVFTSAQDLADQRGVDRVLAALGATESGQHWLDELERRKDPWFYISTGDGFYAHHRCWADDLRVPFSAIGGYIEKIAAGEDLQRPTERLLAERERVAAAYAELLGEEDRAVFQDLLGLSRKVFPHVESHKFFIEHWYTSLFFNKIRVFGELLRRQGVLDDAEDVFYLHFHEVREVLSDVWLAWSGGVAPRGATYWPPRIARRKAILARLADWTPPAALGPIPDVVRDPMVEMLWGVTAEQLRTWARHRDGDSAQALRGYAASPGVVEGVARVIRNIDDIASVLHGEVLVCPVTAPSWGPVFPKIAAAVSDIGGMMSHAAIVAREYGLPAVVGTGHATQLIKTGQRVRVDGGSGTVSVLSSDAPPHGTPDQ